MVLVATRGAYLNGPGSCDGVRTHVGTRFRSDHRCDARERSVPSSVENELRRSSRDDERAVMKCEVMCLAQQAEVARIVRAAIFAVHEVVDVDVVARST